MPRNVSPTETPAPAPGKQVIEEKKTTTIDLPPTASIPFARPGAKGPRPKNPSLNEWWAQTPPDERANNFAYTLYRDDSRIIIVEENLDDRASGSMVYKFKPDEIKAFSDGPFLQELSQWTKEKFGGGEFHIMVNHRKGSTLISNKGFKIEGPPILSSREAWAPGQQPAMSMGGDSSILPMLMKLIDDKLAAVTQNRQDPNTALADVTKAIMDANSIAYKWAIEAAPKASSATEQLQQMREMFGLFKDLQPALPPVATAPADPFAQFNQFATMMKNMRELDAPRDPAPQSIKDMIVEGIKTGLREAGAPRGGPRGTDWGAIFEKALPVLVPLGMGLISRFQTANAAKQPVIQPGTPQYPQFSPPGAPAASPGYGPGGPRAPGIAGNPPGAPVGGPAMRPQAPLQPTPPTPPPAQPSPPEQIVITEDIQGAVLWSHFTRRIVDLLTHDESGDVAAEALDKMFPDVAVHMSMMNEQALMTMIITDPELSKVKDDPRLPPFVQSFLGYFKEVDAVAPVGEGQ